MFHIAIVEDEVVYRDILKAYLKRYEEENSLHFKVSEFSDGDQIVHKYSADYDIIFMDIQMKFMDGMKAAEEIRKLDGKVILMFITNMTQYAIRGYEVDAMDYIVKPVEYFSFSQKLGRAIQRIPKKDSRVINVPVEGGTSKLRLDEIFYVESFGHDLEYRTVKGSVKSRGTLKDLEQELAPHGFFRSGKSYLVNLHYVDAVRNGCCYIGNDKLVISRQKKKEFMNALVKYMN